jgi:hypothetical protein
MNYELMLVALVLIVLALLFILVFPYSHRIEQTTYVGEQMRRAIYSVERQRRVSEVDEAWDRGKYHLDAIGNETWRSEHPLPQRPMGDSVDSRTIDIAIQQLERQGRVGTLPPFSSQTEQSRQYVSDLRHWAETELEKKAKSLRADDIRRCEEAARDESNRALGVIDLATLRGRGPEFILQFTAIVTIVFVVFSLGLIGKLESQQVGTILAAIAGYVLGQATARRDLSGRGRQSSSATDSSKSDAKD